MEQAKNSPSRGVLFVATGDKYVRSAARCARSIHKHNPGLAIHLFTDPESADRLRSGSGPMVFNSIEAISDPHRRSKVDYMPMTPFEYTLYLDSDTAVLTDVREMFSLLDRFDIALAHAMKRNEFKNQVVWKHPMPDSFPQFNSGVVLYRMNPSVKKFFDDWREGYLQAGFKIDQICLRELLWESDLRIATLPPEYNLRNLKYKYIWSPLEARPKILHLPKFHRPWKRFFISPFYRMWKLMRYYGAKIKQYWKNK